MASALSDNTWTDLDGRRMVLVIPVGSVEQHGPHLPLDTDTRIAVALATRVAAQRDDLVLAPPVAFGSSGEHADFPGTLSIGAEALSMVLVELGRSADHFEGVVFVNGHGGNLEPLQRARKLLQSEGRTVLVWSVTLPEADLHAGHTETSLLLSIDPQSVRTDCIAPGDTRPLTDILDIMRTGGVKAVSANGVLGDPTTANAADGHELVQQLVDRLAKEIDRAFPR